MKDKISIERIKKLHPNVINLFQAFIEEAENSLGITLRVTQGLRTFEEQDALYNQPWDKKDNDGDARVDEADEKVTKAKGGQSLHNYGIAIDVVELKNGKANWNFDYSKLKPFAQKQGIDWGGDWKNFVDKPHFEISFGYTWQQLLDKYHKKQFLSGTKFVKL